MNMNMVLVGFLVMLVCQDIVAIKAVKKNTREGILCAMLPGYLVYYVTRKEPGQTKPLLGWLVGATLLLLGLIQ
jgi:hypothetical protein